MSDKCSQCGGKDNLLPCGGGGCKVPLCLACGKKGLYCPTRQKENDAIDSGVAGCTFILDTKERYGEKDQARSAKAAARDDSGGASA